MRVVRTGKMPQPNPLTEWYLTSEQRCPVCATDYVIESPADLVEEVTVDLRPAPERAAVVRVVVRCPFCHRRNDIRAPQAVRTLIMSYDGLIPASDVGAINTHQTRTRSIPDEPVRSGDRTARRRAKQ